MSIWDQPDPSLGTFFKQISVYHPFELSYHHPGGATPSLDSLRFSFIGASVFFAGFPLLLFSEYITEAEFSSWLTSLPSCLSPQHILTVPPSWLS